MRRAGRLCLLLPLLLLLAFALPLAAADTEPAPPASDHANALSPRATALAEGINHARKKKQEIGDMWPMLLIPFIIQALVLPFFLASLKMMAVKSLLVGKIAILLLLFNVLRNAALQSQDTVYKDNLAETHYGYNGGPEIGAWFNR